MRFEQKNGSEDIPFSKFAEEIESIESGPNNIVNYASIGKTVSTGNVSRTITWPTPFNNASYRINGIYGAWNTNSKEYIGIFSNLNWSGRGPKGFLDASREVSPANAVKVTYTATSLTVSVATGTSAPWYYSEWYFQFDAYQKL